VRWDARVPKYDAFGREIGEDPLAGLRDAVAQPNPEPEPVEASVATPADASVATPADAAVATPADAAVAAPAAPEPVIVPPARVEVARPRRRRRGGLAGLLIVVAVIGAAGLATNSAVQEGGSVIDGITPQEAPPPDGVQGRSLVREADFATALKTLQGAGVGQPIMLRVAPDRIDATVVKDGEVHQVQITPDGELHQLGSGADAGTRATVGYGAIDAAAPERLARAGSTRRHPARSIDYVLFTAGPPTTWGAYYKRGRIVIGDRHGRPQRVL
jgi:hypothetical protein